MQPAPDRIVRYLDEAHSSEAAAVDMLLDTLKDFRNPFIRSVLERQMLQSKDQALRLETRLRALGGHPSAGGGLLSSISGRIGGLANAARDPYDRATRDVIIAYGAAHAQLGVYAALSTFARNAGDIETEQLASALMLEKQAAAEQLRPLIDNCAAQTFDAGNK